MIKGGKGGASTLTGLEFESISSLKKFFNNIENYEVIGDDIIYDGKKAAQFIGKHKLYRFLGNRGVNWENIISKRLLPDEALYITSSNKVYIIEMKSQKVGGSVDEKLQTCDFKLRQYKKLFEPLGIEVHFIYLLDDWFKDSSYRDVLNYIKTVNCNYFFQSEGIPFEYFGLPNTTENT
ncbi:hypothetical protein P5G51_003910 [Virgibacillus sp. 179-BFC.A HS]|uniref:Uncharacterized protein n=1 Tax=Tigheibacillus jepli TaxID=3035914 RepID=A0ABU5CEK9_9BACI|nr:hypothetical protein [Virgibacillus sp. 179-BFC.A HS]MDY0404660.1 hypothetical protein [Virgibacillus sp. 179-BFC.A HS]